MQTKVLKGEERVNKKEYRAEIHQALLSQFPLLAEFLWDIEDF